jgi:hypothetical protein
MTSIPVGRAGIGFLSLLTVLVASFPVAAAANDSLLKPGGKLVLEEDWPTGKLDHDRWYALRKKWGAGNFGVSPENVRIDRDIVNGHEQNVLVCEAHGDEYDGPVIGLNGNNKRVGGVLVSKQFFASGRFEVVMKIGSDKPHDGGPVEPAWPRGAVPAIWTYGYRFVGVEREQMNEFVAAVPLYNPLMKRYGTGANEYTSEIDFPEFGKKGDFTHTMYNAYCQTREQSETFAVTSADGQYHTYTTEWRTKLQPLVDVNDAQVIEQGGFWWVRDKAIKFDRYWGNPLKRLDKNRYAVYTGDRADHWIDGIKVAQTTRGVPAMAAQLNIGIWLPQWAGPAPWKTARASFASVKVWQFDDPGDVRGVITADIGNNFDEKGKPTKDR